MIATASEMALDRKYRRQAGRLRDGTSGEDAGHHQHEAKRRALQHFAGPPVTQIESHEDRDRHGRGDGERPPRAALERVDHYQAHHRQQDDHDQQHGDQRDEAADLADLLARHLPQRFAVAAHGGEQDDEVLHGAAQARADDDPQCAGQVAELCGQHRANQRSRARQSRRSDGRRRSTCWSARNRDRCGDARPVWPVCR